MTVTPPPPTQAEQLLLGDLRAVLLTHLAFVRDQLGDPTDDLSSDLEEVRREQSDLEEQVSDLDRNVDELGDRCGDLDEAQRELRDALDQLDDPADRMALSIRPLTKALTQVIAKLEALPVAPVKSTSFFARGLLPLISAFRWRTAGGEPCSTTPG